MAGRLSFKVTVYQTDTHVLPELGMKAKDLSPVFEDIVDAWADLNAQKFRLAGGGEASGAQVDPTVFWKALSPQYLKWKQKHFPTDTIMVRTGSLMAALTSRTGFFRMVNPEQAVFGTPNDAEDAAKIQFNWATRQAIFLSDPDQNMIREKVSKYFTVQMKNIREEVAQMDADFAATVNS